MILLVMLAEGKTVKEIAASLGIKPGSVEVQIGQARHRAGIGCHGKDRVNAIREYLQNRGIILSSPPIRDDPMFF